MPPPTMDALLDAVDLLAASLFEAGRPPTPRTLPGAIAQLREAKTFAQKLKRLAASDLAAGAQSLEARASRQIAILAAKEVSSDVVVAELFAKTYVFRPGPDATIVGAVTSLPEGHPAREWLTAADCFQYSGGACLALGHPSEQFYLREDVLSRTRLYREQQQREEQSREEAKTREKAEHAWQQADRDRQPEAQIRAIIGRLDALESRATIPADEVQQLRQALAEQQAELQRLREVETGQAEPAATKRKR